METTLGKKPISFFMAMALVGLAAPAVAPVEAATGIYVPDGNDGYWRGRDGFAVMSGNGVCWRTGSWTREKTIPACEGQSPDAAVSQYRPSSSVTRQPPEPVAVAPEPEPSTPPVTLAQTLFDTDQANIKPAGKNMLDTLARQARNEDATVIATGHASSPGTDEHNMQLSRQRSEAVKDYLVNQGVDEDRIQVIARGEHDPVADNATSSGRRLNRRVELEVIPSSG